MKKLVDIVLLLFVIILVSSCSQVIRKENLPQTMDENLCSSVRGHWNNCSSPCIGTDADYCIEVCVAQCECGGIAGFGCPDGYSCRLTGKIANEMGACIRE